MTAKRLRSVKPGETPVPRKRPMTLVQAVNLGDERAFLVALRDRIVKTVADPNCPPRELAALSRRLQEIVKEIGLIDVRAKQEVAEETKCGDEPWNEELI